MLKTFELAKKDDMNRIYILSDESCNYKFYESCGCNKIYDTIIENLEYGKLNEVKTEKAYIYEKKLN